MVAIAHSQAIGMSAHELPLRITRWSSNRMDDQFPVMDPATDRTVTVVQGSGAAEVDAAVMAAKKAFERDWRRRPVAERSHMSSEAARLIRQHADELTHLVSAHTGTLQVEARMFDVDECAKAFHYFGSAALPMPNGFIDGGTYHDQIMAEPYGVVAALTPTTWPLSYVGAKLAPALVAGNVVVLKPSCASSLAVMRLCELIAPIFPNDVLQLVLGRGDSTGRALVNHPLVNKISFAGDIAVGQEILHAAANKVVPSIMQLGARNAIIIFDDADLNLALRAILEGAYSNHGEARSALPRVFVQRSSYQRVLTQLARAVPRLKVGDGMNVATHIGPMSTRDKQQLALKHIADACAQGARIVAQAPVPSSGLLRDGYFVPPTVLADVRPDMSIIREAVFGPFACVMPFNSIEEAINLTNDSKYGLLAVIFTQNHAVATQVSRRLEVGAVYVNNFQRSGYSGMPLNGTKLTGYGREERSPSTLHEYTRQRVMRMPTDIPHTRYWPAVDEILAG